MVGQWFILFGQLLQLELLKGLLCTKENNFNNHLLLLTFFCIKQ